MIPLDAGNGSTFFPSGCCISGLKNLKLRDEPPRDDTPVTANRPSTSPDAEDDLLPPNPGIYTQRAAMSAARPASSLLGGCVAAASVAAPRRASPIITTTCLRQFHSSPVTRSKRKTRFRNITAEEMGLLEPKKMKKYTQEKFPELPEEYLKEVEKKYGKKHVEAILAGEKAVSVEDLAIQGRMRDDSYRPQYIEDYAKLNPKIDIKPDYGAVKAEKLTYPTLGEFGDELGMKMIRLTQQKTDDQLSRAMVRALRKVKESKGAELLDLTMDELDDLEQNPELLQKYLVADDAEVPANASGPEFMTRAQAEQLDEAIDKEMSSQLEEIERADDVTPLQPTDMELMADGPAGTIRMHSTESVELGKVHGVAGLYKLPSANSDETDDSGAYDEVQRITGMSLNELRSLFNKVLVTRFVHNQTRLGKVRSLSVLAICGNGNGRLGMAMAKSTEGEVAVTTAKMLAIRNMKPIRRYENRTVFGNVKAKVSGTVVELYARPPGMFSPFPPVDIRL